MDVFVVAGKDFGLVLHAIFLREPSLREECIGKGREASRVPMDDIRWDERIVAFGDKAIIKEKRLTIYNRRVGQDGLKD
jgi:hypothetical protein